MKYFPLLITLLNPAVAADCYVTVTAGYHSDFGSKQSWVGESSMGNVLMVDCTERVSDKIDAWAGWIHTSHLMRGEPFDKRKESHLDHFGIGIRIKVW